MVLIDVNTPTNVSCDNRESIPAYQVLMCKIALGWKNGWRWSVTLLHAVIWAFPRSINSNLTTALLQYVTQLLIPFWNLVQDSYEMFGKLIEIVFSSSEKPEGSTIRAILAIVCSVQIPPHSRLHSLKSQRVFFLFLIIFVLFPFNPFLSKGICDIWAGKISPRHFWEKSGFTEFLSCAYY